jgi:hypothetical protein
VIWLYLRLRFHANAQFFRFGSCGSRRAVSLHCTGKRLFPCMKCRQTSVHVTIAGRS